MSPDRINELNNTLGLSLERESKLKGDVTDLKNDAASLHDKLKDATAAYARIDAPKSTISDKALEFERLNIEIASVKSQLLKVEESRDAQ